jgi:broad specificity phosphatase PhoE
MRLYLITHAHTRQDRTADATHWQLSPQGMAQAQRLAQQPFWAQVTQVVLSREAKTRLTIEPVLAARNLPVWMDARFDELHRPGWVEDYASQVQHAFAKPDQPAGEWERANAARQRFLAGLASVIEKFAADTVALVGHGLTLSLYRAFLLGQPQVAFADWQRLSFAAVALVDPIAGKIIQDFQAVAGELPRG